MENQELVATLKGISALLEILLSKIDQLDEKLQGQMNYPPLWHPMPVINPLWQTPTFPPQDHTPWQAPTLSPDQGWQWYQPIEWITYSSTNTTSNNE